MGKGVDDMWSPSSVVIVALFVGVLCIAVPDDANAQSLAEMYRTARFKAQSERLLNGFRPHSQPVAKVQYPTDSLREWVEIIFPTEAEPAPVEQESIQIRKWQVIPKLGRSWFEKKFEDTRWTFVGSNELTPLDTTFTRDLRARLEATFGSPTQTIPDLDITRDSDPAEYVQFEYWFVLNDSIPLQVMDVNGPFERGLVVATRQEYGNILPDLKYEFIGQILTSNDRDPYVDYYYLPDQQMWFLSGFDGDRYFLERVGRPDLKLGRPLLERERD